MQIRKMILSDYNEVLALWQTGQSLGLRSLDDSKEGIAKFLDRNPETCFVAIEKNILVGSILCGHDGRRGYIYHTIIHPDFQNKGYASSLVNSACSALKKEGITRVCLNVIESNEGGKRFWQKLGWEKKDFLSFYSKSITDKQNLPLFEIE